MCRRPKHCRTSRAARSWLRPTLSSRLYIVDDKGDHVLAGTGSGVYETLDGAVSWRLIAATEPFGLVRTMKNGTIHGKPHILAQTK